MKKSELIEKERKLMEVLVGLTERLVLQTSHKQSPKKCVAGPKPEENWQNNPKFLPGIKSAL